MNHRELYYAIALHLVPGMGVGSIRHLLEKARSFEAIFALEEEQLARDFEMRKGTIRALRQFDNWKRVDEEISLIETNDIRATTLLDSSFPYRLVHNDYAPVILFYQGNIDFNAERMISFVGTRKNTEYGKDITRKIIRELSYLRPTIVSGLAVGIDILAHRAALENDLPTIAVVAHGLHTIYPSSHRSDVLRMIQQGGGVISHYFYHTASLPAHFADRNKVIAALSDATLVVESGIKGGSMITAAQAYEFDKEVLALPGRAIDSRSAGTNELIKTLRASMVTSAEDIVQILGWDLRKKPTTVTQKNLFLDLSEDEIAIIAQLKLEDVQLDKLAKICKMSTARIASTLVQLELKGVVKTLPGKVFRLIQ